MSIGLIAVVVGACGEEPQVEARIAAASTKTCHLAPDGLLRCWGEATGVQPAERDDPDFVWPASDLPGLVTDVAVGPDHVCAVLESGGIACWGSTAEYPRLGKDSNASPAPIVVTEVDEPFIQVDVNANHSCGVTSGGELWCWGWNQLGVLGHADPEPLGDDELVADAGPVPLGEAAVSVATAYAFTCALLEGGGVRCWGTPGLIHGTHPPCPETPECRSTWCCPIFLPTELSDVPLPEAAVEISAGRTHACALTTSGEVFCWGPKGASGSYPTEDEIGDDESPLEVGPVELGSRAHSVAAGDRHTCALLSRGQLRCWGDNAFGQLGLASLEYIGDDELPADAPPVQLGDAVVTLAAGSAHTCAQLRGGAVRCWGNPSALGVLFEDDGISCHDEMPNPDQGHGSPPSLFEFDCTNGRNCCFGDDEHPDQGEPVPL